MSTPAKVSLVALATLMAWAVVVAVLAGLLFLTRHSPPVNFNADRAVSSCSPSDRGCVE